MPKLTIDTTASVYEPVEVVIDGETFTLQKLTLKEIREIEALDREVAAGRLEALYKRLYVLFGEHEKFSTLTLDRIADIMRFVVAAIQNPERAEKNSPSPGDNPQP